MPNTKQEANKDYIWGKRKNKKWIFISVGVVVVIAGVAGYLIFGLNLDDQGSSNTANKSQSGDTVRRAIDGVMVPADQANYFPVAVVIENLVAARPQSGLSQANIVYEALAEGGITRFLALYAGQPVSEIGPVRSARPYFVDLVLEYGALFAHAGGSPQAIADIRSEGVFDLNQFYNSQYYWRDKTRQVASEHTLFSSSQLLTFALRDKKAAATADFDSWIFKDDTPLNSRPQEQKTITIDFSSFSYKVEYSYDRAKNDYVRSLAGAPHLDKGGAAIRPKNVIVQKVKTRLIDAERLGMDIVGQGDAIVFRDGVATVGHWEKKSKTGRTTFTDAAGVAIEFNAGQTWVEVVPTDREILYN